MTFLILAVFFFAVFLLVLGLYSFINREQLTSRGAIRERLRSMQPEETQYEIIRTQRRSAVPVLDAVLRDQPFVLRIEQALAYSGLPWSVGEFLLSSTLGAILGIVLFQRWGGGMAIIGLCFGLCTPLLVIRRATKRRKAKIEAQLPDAVEMIVNAMRAGFSLTAAIQFVGEELPDPLGSEFVRFSEEQRLGTDTRAALTDLQNRIGTLDAKMLVTALLMQRESGGNLTEVLLSLANVIRARVAFRERVATLTAEPKASALVLGLLPVLTFGLMFLARSEFMRPLVTTTTGKWILAYSAVSVLLGTVILRKMADIDI